MPEWFDKNFPDWKKNLIGGLRAFVTGFMGSVVACLVTASPDVVLTEDFWLRAVIVGGLSGGLVYLGKYLRDKFYSSEIVQRLPI